MAKIILFISLSNLIYLSLACLITNCPRGGKRNDPAILSMQNLIKECRKCGPENQGQCFGPQICCGPTMGCLIGTPESYRCRGESLYSHPCIAGFSMCKENTGRCAANNICCSQESCTVDPTCKISEEFFERKTSFDLSRIITNNEQ